MKEENTLTKIFAYLSILSGAVWLGAYITRLMVSYQLFNIDMNFINYVNKQNIEGIMRTIAPTVNITFVSYIIFIVVFTLFLITTNLKLKRNGWLFIIAIIVYFTLPFEVYLLSFDYKIISDIYFSDAANFNKVLDLIKEQLHTFSGFPLIILFGYFAAVYFLLFKPLTTKDDK
ncbi:hypothetical protein BMS3Abin03_01954 [bacterium BMS3Abin03]|nr:hypothetical protein BMS3Abin03_01954 [bacterium BMS3Abin03]